MNQQELPPKSAPIVLIVIGTIAFVTVLYAVTLCVCAINMISPPPDIISNFKDVGLVALGALGSLLARTGHEATKQAEPQAVVVENTKKNPVQTQESKPPVIPLAILLIAAMSLTGCFTLGLTYTDENDRTYGGSIGFSEQKDVKLPSKKGLAK